MEKRLPNRLNADDRGLEGLPLQLLIIALVLSLGLPVVYSSIRYHDTQRVLQELEEKAVFIGEKARQIYLHGEGNSEVLTLDLEDGMFHAIEFLEVTNGTYRDQLQWRIEGGEGGRHFVQDNFLLISEGTPLRLKEGEHRLRLECEFGSPSEIEENILYVKVAEI